MPGTVTFNFDPSVPSREDVERLFTNLEETINNARGSDKFNCGTGVFDELILRLQQLRERYHICLALNDDCLSDQSVKMYFDHSREAFVTEIDGKIVHVLKLRRTDPSNPGVVESVGQMSAFVPGSSSPAEGSPRSSLAAERKLSAEVEDFYYKASKFWDLLEQGCLGKKKSKFIGVKMVRNKLLEHADRKAVNSFGATDRKGPLIKPMRDTEAKGVPHDLGLIPNVHELLTRSKARLSS